MQKITSTEDIKNLQTQTLVVTNVSEIKTETTRKDGKPSREYFTVSVRDIVNIMDDKAIQKRTVFQSYNSNNEPEWKINPADVVKGVQMPGAIVNFETEPYFIKSDNGKELHETTGEVGNYVTGYKTFLLPSEMASENAALAVLKQSGKTLKGMTQTATVREPAVVAEPVTEDETF